MNTVSRRAPTPRLVVGFDGSPEAMDAARWAADYAALVGLQVTLVVSVKVPSGWDRLTRELQQDYRDGHVRYADHLQSDHPGVRIDGRFTLADPAEELARASRGGDLVVLGKQVPLGSWAPLRSMSGTTIRHSGTAPVFVLPAPVTELAGDRVVAGVDLADMDVLDAAARLAEHLGMPLQVVSCLAHPDEAEERSRRDAFGAALPPGVDAEVDVRVGSPESVLPVAAQGAMVLVVGSRRQSALGAALFGSVSRALTANAPCAVAVI